MNKITSPVAALKSLRFALFLFLMVFDENTINEVWYILVVNTHTDTQFYDKLWFLGCQLKNEDDLKYELWCLRCLNVIKDILVGLWPILTWCHIRLHINYISALYVHALSRDHFVHVPSQWEMTFHCSVISRWLGTYTKWSLPVREVLLGLKRYPGTPVYRRYKGYGMYRGMLWGRYDTIWYRCNTCQS